MKYLFLDDYRLPQDCVTYMPGRLSGIELNEYLKDHWTVVKNYAEFVKYIEENGLPYLISFDHDLADEHYCDPAHYDDEKYQSEREQEYKEKTGYHCAQWLVEYCIANSLSLPKFWCHSMNPIGTKRILDLLNQVKKIQQSI